MIKVKFSELKGGDMFSLPGDDNTQFVKLANWALITDPGEDIGEDYKNAVKMQTGELEGFADKDYVNKLEL